jgi:hypothetical protein
MYVNTITYSACAGKLLAEGAHVNAGSAEDVESLIKY